MIFFKEPVHFLHIGKTGGTSIISQLMLLNQIKDCPYHFHFYNHQVRLKHLPFDQKYFFAVRDPVDRFVSGFYSTKHKNKGMPWTQDETIAFENFSDANELAESLFSDSLRGLAAHDAMKSIKHVADFQIDWITSANVLTAHWPAAVLNQKTLEQDFNQLLKKLNMQSVVLPTQNTATEHASMLSDRAIENIKIWYQRDIKFVEYVTQLSLD
jgi:hypothetical protein